MLTFLCALNYDNETTKSLLIIGILFVLIICGLLTKQSYKYRGYQGGFWLGFLLGIVGVIIAANLPSKKDILKDVYDEIEKNSK